MAVPLVYDDIQDFTYNPFTDTCTLCPIGYAGADCEVRDIPAASPYFVCLYHAAVENVPSYTDIYIGATQLTEVAKTVCPANNQYRVNYDEKGRGIVEFHANQASCTACICYCHVGTLISKDALDVRLNVYCGTNCALCAFATNQCGIYSCACNIGLYGESCCNNGVYGKAGCNVGVYGCAICNVGVYGKADINIGVRGEAVCCGGYFIASCYCGLYAQGVCGYAGCFCSCVNYGLKAKANSCYGVCGEASCYGGVFCALEYGICVKGVYDIAGYFCSECDNGIIVIADCNCGIVSCVGGITGGYFESVGNYGIIAVAGGNNGGYFEATSYAILACATNNFGISGHGVCYGIHGVATSCYGVCGIATTARPISGNGAYYDSTSSRQIKTNRENISILDCFKMHPDFKVQKWQYADSNQKGFDYFIGPYADDLQCVFELTFDNTGLYNPAGIALGATIELYHRLVLLEEKIKKLELNYGN